MKMDKLMIVNETFNRMLMFEAQLDLIKKMCGELMLEMKLFRTSWLESYFEKEEKTP